jgi:toxin HigB-1
VVIQSFGSRQTEDLWNGVATARTRRLAPEVGAIAPRKLDLLHAAARLDDLRAPPGNRLEALHGDRRGFHNIRINDQWRVVFRWTSAGPADVEVVDDHR